MAPEPASPGPLAGRVALVTGAAQGMGAAHARRLAREGAVVAVNDLHDSDSLRALADEIGGLTAPGDVSEPGQVRALVSAVAEAAGCLDVLVANHAYMTMAPFWSTPRTTGGRSWTPTSGDLPPGAGGPSAHACQGEWAHRRRHQRVGDHRLARRHGIRRVEGGTRLPRQDHGARARPEGIIVNAIAPGVTDTPQLEVDARDAGTTLEEMHRRYAAGIPLGRIGTADEMAAVVALRPTSGCRPWSARWCRPTAAPPAPGRDGATSRPRPTARGRKMAEQYARYDDGVVGGRRPQGAAVCRSDDLCPPAPAGGRGRLRRGCRGRPLGLRGHLPPRGAVRPVRDPPGVAPAAAVQPGPRRAAVP